MEFGWNEYDDPPFGPALAALSRHTSLRHLTFHSTLLGDANIKHLIGATWPELTRFTIDQADFVELEEPDFRELDDASFTGFPKLEVLALATGISPLVARQLWRAGAGATFASCV